MFPDAADGNTPLDPDELEGLLPAGVLTRADLNAWEQAGIRRARSWALDRRNPVPLQRVLSEAFLRDLHRRMFAITWSWAGSYRRSDKNIGPHWATVPVVMRDALHDASLWIHERVYPPREVLARFHHRLVVIHPFPNGNGRWSRLATDVLARTLSTEPPTWGAGLRPALARREYIEALRKADSGEFAELTTFLWS
jgi:Fic-DOC domain mobile mystery protein B